jgi:hypothetical protein
MLTKTNQQSISAHLFSPRRLAYNVFAPPLCLQLHALCLLILRWLLQLAVALPDALHAE